MRNFDNGALRITNSKNGKRVTMDWTGESSGKDPASELTPYFNSLLTELTGSELTIQYNHLHFMNSSSVRVILSLITQLNAAGIPTVVTYDAKSQWQKMSFKALANYCYKMPHITVQGI